MKGMTLIVKKTTQLIAGMIFMYGIYVIVHGHLTPGGGFAGGVISCRFTYPGYTCLWR